jgi:hypothetical protein
LVAIHRAGWRRRSDAPADCCCLRRRDSAAEAGDDDDDDERPRALPAMAAVLLLESEPIGIFCALAPMRPLRTTR